MDVKLTTLFFRIATALAIAATLAGCKPETPNTSLTDGPILIPSSTNSNTSTPEPTATQLATATERPTATATPEAGIDMEMFNRFPESREYLAAHLDEFVQAPDPFTQRAAFDKWWDEKLIPALGEKSQRELTGGIDFGGLSDHFDTWVGATTDYRGAQLLRMPQFFYFISGETIYPVPIFNFAAPPWYPDTTMFTMMPVLFYDGYHTSDQLYRTMSGENVTSVDIYKTTGWNSFVDRFIGAGLSPGVDVNTAGKEIIFGPGRVHFLTP